MVRVRLSALGVVHACPLVPQTVLVKRAETEAIQVTTPSGWQQSQPPSGAAAASSTLHAREQP